MADKAHDSNALHALIATMGAEAVFPCNPTQGLSIPYGFEACKGRSTIGRCSNRHTHVRRAATRFARQAAHLLGSLYRAAALLWMR